MNKKLIPRVDTAIGSQLRNLLPQGTKMRRKGQDIRDPIPSPSGVDGVDHINIWDRGNTELGKLLSHSAALSFVHNIFGRFNTIESFWHYIRSVERDDRIRTMSGLPLKRFSEKLQTVRVRNFKAIIMDANWQKVKQYPILVEELTDSTLPIECYYHYKREDGVRIRPNFSPWLIQGFTEIRNALKENREPNFDFLKDNPNTGIYDFVHANGGKKQQTKFTAEQSAETSRLMARAQAASAASETVAEAASESVLEAVVSAAEVNVANEVV